MAKTKRRSRHKDARKKTATDEATAVETPRPTSREIKANPPSANLPMLILCGALVAGWLVYLAIVALNA